MPDEVWLTIRDGKDEFGRDVVACRLCGKPTAMTSTKLCDPCWELETRIHHQPELARKILSAMKAEHA